MTTDDIATIRAAVAQVDIDHGRYAYPSCIIDLLRLLAPVAAGEAVIVPVEPSQYMIDAADNTLFSQYKCSSWDEAKEFVENFDAPSIYRAMIRASQPAKSRAQGGA